MVAFKCLGNKSVIEAQLSDHEPIIDGAVCVFNLMCRGSGSNNFFKKSETPGEYAQRLDQLIQVIKELKNSGVDVFFFQEAPQYNGTDDPSNSFYNKLSQIPGFEQLDIRNITNTTGTRSAMFTIADYNRYPLQQNTTTNLNLNIPGRVQSIQLTSKDQQSLTLVNIHGDYSKQQDTRTALRKCANTVSACIIGGDFNITSGITDISEFQGSGIYQKAELFNTCDGLLSSKKGRVQDLAPVIETKEKSIVLIVQSINAKGLLDNFKNSPQFLSLNLPLERSGYISGIKLNSPPELLMKGQSQIIFTGTNAVALHSAFDNYMRIPAKEESIVLIVNSTNAKELLNNFKYSPQFLSLNMPLDGYGYIPNIKLSSSPELLSKGKSQITFTGTYANALSAAFNSYMHSQITREHTSKNVVQNLHSFGQNQKPIDTGSKRTVQDKPSVTIRNSNKVEEARALFFICHEEEFKRAKSGWFGFFRKTEVKPNMTLQELLEHAQKHNNRSRYICVALGWMDEHGALKEEGRELMRLSTSPSIKI